MSRTFACGVQIDQTILINPAVQPGLQFQQPNVFQGGGFAQQQFGAGGGAEGAEGVGVGAGIQAQPQLQITPTIWPTRFVDCWWTIFNCPTQGPRCITAGPCTCPGPITVSPQFCPFGGGF